MSGKIKHTPGPWELLEEKSEEEYYSLFINIIVPDGSKYPNKIGLIFSGDDDDPEIHNPEAIANARLIAAAPDAYEILSFISKRLEQDNRFPDPSTLFDGNPGDEDKLTNVEELTLYHAIMSYLEKVEGVKP